MQITSVTKKYTVSKLLFTGPRDMGFYQFSVHRSDKQPKLSAKAKKPIYRYMTSKIVWRTDSMEDAGALYLELFSAHRKDRLCLNISRRYSLQDYAEQAAAFDANPTTLMIRKRKFTDEFRKGQSDYMKSILDTPWLHPTVKGSESKMLMWSAADEIYDHWHTVKDVRYGSGCKAINTLFGIRFGFRVDTFSMIRRFKTGWNPHLDLNWQTYYN